MENNLPAPSDELGSTARSSRTAEDHSGCERKALVKMPVPDPTLCKFQMIQKGGSRVAHSSTLKGGDEVIADRIAFKADGG